MRLEMQARVGLITGAGSGIGFATALAFANEGARVIVADRDVVAAERTAGVIRAAGGDAVAVGVDVTDPSQVTTMVRSAVERWGGLHWAVNCAGIGPRSVSESGRKAADLSLEGWNRILQVNLTGVWLCLREEIHAMSGGGAIVNIASIAGLVGLPGSAAYVASKHGVVGLTKAAALDYAAAGVRVNAICPGYVETPLTEATVREHGDKLSGLIPVHRLGHADEIASMAVWLCSDRASYVTGSIHVVDGGYTAA